MIDNMKQQNTNAETFSIGQVAKRAGLGIETIRFYERKGLIKDPPRRPSGYREYSENVISKLIFIQRAKELGFSLKEISELLSLKLDSKTTCKSVKKKTEEKLSDIDRKIKALQRIKKALQKLSQACSGSGQSTDCPILDALEMPTNNGKKR